ncbi:MAG: TM2 domain-containing protein [Bacilli bacterium]|nr:TM2 domain-containing protein [Bacilli bacterium]
MPYCRNCHKEISKFDTDICPHCGEKEPIDSSYKTMDITTHLSQEAKGFKLYKAKSHKKVILLSCLLGYVGAHNFYLGFKKMALIEIAITVLLVLGVGLPLVLTGCFANPFAFIIPFAVIWAAYAVNGFRLKAKEDLKDSNGELVH